MLTATHAHTLQIHSQVLLLRILLNCVIQRMLRVGLCLRSPLGVHFRAAVEGEVECKPVAVRGLMLPKSLPLHICPIPA